MKSIADPFLRRPVLTLVVSLLVLLAGLVSLPLLAALGNAAVQMSHLAARSATLVHEGLESTRHVQSLAPTLLAMQRRTGLWLYTDNAGLQLDVAEQHAGADQAIDALLALPQPPAMRDRL